MLTPRPAPLMTAEDMEKTGLLFCVAAFFLAVIFICVFGENPQ